MMTRPTIIRGALFMATVVAIWGVFSLGDGSDAELDELLGFPSPVTYEAKDSTSVVDTQATKEAQQQARDSVEPVVDVSTDVQREVEEALNEVFDDVASLVVLSSSAGRPPIPELPEQEGVEPGDSTTTTTSDDPPMAVIGGRVFVDIDGDGTFNPDGEGERVDAGVRGVRVEVITSNGTFGVQTDAEGQWTAEIDTGVAVVVVDPTDPRIPQGWVPGSGELAQVVTCDPGQVCSLEGIGLVVNLRPLAEIEAGIESRYPALQGDTRSYLAATASEDVIRAALGESVHLLEVRAASIRRLYEEFGQGIREDQLPAAQSRVRTNPPLVLDDDTGLRDNEGSAAAADVVATNIRPNITIDGPETQRRMNDAALAVEDVTISIVAGQIIVSQGEILEQAHIDAIKATVLGSRGGAERGLLAVIAVMVGVIGLYLSRFRTELWSRPRMIALLGIILLLAAASVRATVLLEEATSLYLLPAVAFGLITAVLFDQRIALLMALAVGVLTALGTLDVGLTVYGVLAAMAPIPFVSAISSRGAFRNAVVFSSIAAATIAAATSSFFHVGANETHLEVVGPAILWAFATSAVASLVGLAALQFFESAFDITTTLGLLDLTDRNHEALQLLQEEAFGTFNHSLMVGTLADAASRAIGANPLLSRAMAYYHDLGKTKNPTYFIENQFGMQNPHDFLDPKESAEIIRSHVTAGIALARRFKIPSEVAQGIVSHHGDGVMRFFYEKARAQSGEEVDIDDFRHIGHKPRTAETAILMLADSLEAACRAVFQTSEPTPDAIEKVASRIIDEKIEDGQLAESPLTLSELTQIRKAFIDSLVGHYHQRIAYPNFPGS